MKYLREFDTGADVVVDALPNVVLVNSDNKVYYNIKPTGVYIQHIDGKLYTTEEWTAGGYANDAANGVAVVGNECRFVIAKTSLGHMAWSSDTSNEVSGILTTTALTTAETDFAGAENTELMLAADTAEAGYSCANYTFPNGAKGYLPAMGEWTVAYANKAAIDTALAAIGGDAIPTSFHWSSTQLSATGAWGLAWGSGGVGTGSKSDGNYYVRAFSALTFNSLTL